MLPKINPGGLRRPLASQVGAWSLPKSLLAPLGALFGASSGALGRKGLQTETWLSWNGKRERRESPKHCKRRKSSESSKRDKSRSASTRSRSSTRVARAARSSTKQACISPGARARGAATQERLEHQQSHCILYYGDRFCPSSPAARARRAVRAGGISKVSLGTYPL